MFVQVIQGKVHDGDQALDRIKKWKTEVAAGSVGWLGSTAGVTEDGDLVVLARFESEEAAGDNAARPEQTAWWEETAAAFDGEPRFSNSVFVHVDTARDPGEAGFVQVMQGQVSDLERARSLMTDESVDMSAARPDILGTLLVGHDGGGWTMAIYFTSEAAAREGEQVDPPPELAEMMQELDELSLAETSYFDLRDPWLGAPG